MAYVPPHKRHTTENKGLTLTPDLLVPKFKKNINLSPSQNSGNAYKVEYANNAVTRWIPIGLDDDEQIPSSLQLRSFSVEAIERMMGVETLELVNASSQSELSQARSEHWLAIVENVLPDLVSSFEAVRNEMNSQSLEDVKPALVVRLGKILFHDRTVKAVGCSPTKASLGYMKRIFYADILDSHMDHIEREVVPKIGVEFLQEKSIYHVRLSDNSRPGSLISCKCSVAKGASRLELYKLQLNRLRHMTVDISCLDMNRDLRLMLFSKRTVSIPTKEESKSISNLVRPAILSKEERESIINLVRYAVPDGNVKGGIRWPSGMASSEDRFRVVGVSHTISKAYDSSSIRLKLRHADHFDFRTSTEEVTNEVVVKLKGVTSALLEQKLEMDSVSNMLKGDLKMIWEHFLSN